MHCRGFPVSFHSGSERGEESSLGFAAISAWAGLDYCSCRAVSCPETAVNLLCPTCLSFIPPSHPVLVFVLCYQWQFFDLFHLLKREEICVLASHLFLTSSAGWNSTRMGFLGAWGGKGLSCSHRQSRKNEKEAIKLVSVPLHWDLLSSPWD